MRRSKNVLCTTLSVDVMGPANVPAKSIRTAEKIVLDALRHLERDFKSNRIVRKHGFVLSLPEDKAQSRKGGRNRGGQR